MYTVSLVLGKLKSIWALALSNDTLYKKPCKAISWEVYFLLLLELYVTRTIGKTPALQRLYSMSAWCDSALA